jgi:Holliday junction resolvase
MEFKASNGFTVRSDNYTSLHVDNVYLNREHLEALVEFANHLKENPVR